MASAAAVLSSPLRVPALNLNNNNNNNNNTPTNSRRKQLRSGAATATPIPVEQKKKKHWKTGEFPGIAESNATHRKSRSPIKNLKKKLDKKAKSKAWVNTVTESLSHFILIKDFSEALRVFDMLRDQPFYFPKESTYVKLIVLLGRCSQPLLARRLFDQSLLEGLPPSPQLYTALLAAYSRNGLLDDAFTVLHSMKALPLCQPDVFTYSILIKACVDSSRFDIVHHLYDEMSERGIAPNTVTHNTVLAGYGKAGLYDDMERVLSGMLLDQETNSNSRPDVWTMNIFLSVFGNKGHIELMERWYEKFRDFGIQPETRTFNILIGAYGKMRMYDKMSSVMEYMRKLEFSWTTSTYNNVIEAFADVGDVKNMEYTFNQMRSEGMKADTKTFCCLINGNANAGLFHKVISSVQLAAKFEIPENTSFYNTVISACAKADDLMELDRVYKRMRDRQCPPDTRTFEIMVDAYNKVGMNDKVFDLEQERLGMLSLNAMSSVVE